jgi:PKD repeat protein
MKINKLLLTAIGFLMMVHVSMAQTTSNHAGKTYLNSINDKYTTPQNTGLRGAYLNFPEGICADTNGRIYFTHWNRVMIIDGNNLRGRAGGAGDPTFSSGHNDLNGIGGRFNEPRGIAVNPNTNEVYIADWGNNCIRKMSQFVNASNTQILSTYTGSSSASNEGSTDGLLANAKFRGPYDLVVMNNGDIIVTDEDNSTIRKISGGSVSTIAGSPTVEDDVDGVGSAARLTYPRGICIKDQNTVLFTDFGNGKIKELNLTTNAVKTVVDGLIGPQDVEYINGVIYYSERSKISKYENSTKTLLLGSSFSQDSTFGTYANTRFGELKNLVYNKKDENLYAVDYKFGIIKKIELKVSPQVDFVASTTSPSVNQIINLTDQTTNRAGTRLWTITPSNYTLVNGTTLTSEVVQVQFGATGSYTIKLVYTYPGGTAEEEKIGYINVSSINAAPSANFEASTTLTAANVNIQLTDLSSNTPTSWLWEITPSTGVTYKNSTTSASQLPVVSFANEGTYTVKLTATNSFGSDDETKTGYITIDNSASINTIQKDVLVVYPQPANTELYIKGIFLNANYTIYNTLGQPVMNGQLDKQKINISNLTQGVYSIVIKDIDGNQTQTKFVKN